MKQQAEEFIDRIMAHKNTIPDGAKRPRYTIPVRYPSPTEIVRAAPEEKLHANGWAMIMDPATGEVYFIGPRTLWQSGRELIDSRVPIAFALVMSSKGASFLWPYLANYVGALCAETAVEEARDHWVRVTIDKAVGDYHSVRETGIFDKPRWPRLERDDVIDIVFADREIGHRTHPALKRILGEVDA